MLKYLSDETVDDMEVSMWAASVITPLLWQQTVLPAIRGSSIDLIAIRYGVMY